MSLALCGDDAACRHQVDSKKGGVQLAAELTEAAGKLYVKLEKGLCWDGAKKQRINHDVTKLKYALELSPMEKDLVEDLTFQHLRRNSANSFRDWRVSFWSPGRIR